MTQYKFVDGQKVAMTPDEEAAFGTMQGEWADLESERLFPITRRQLRLTLLDHGLLNLVEPAIATLPEPARSEALIEWQDASEYKRTHPLISQIGAALSLSSEQIDAMWREAMGR